MQTMVQAGLAAAILIFILFALLWIREVRKISKEKLTTGTKFNAAGFGLLPGLAAWKIPHLTRGDYFAPDRIELLAILLAFAAVVIWLVIRRRPLPGNGDLFLNVICMCSAIRIITETLREHPVRLGEDGVSVFMLGAVAAEIVAMAIWTARRAHQSPSSSSARAKASSLDTLSVSRFTR